MNERMPTFEILNKFAHDYKVVFVSDATMAPYEIHMPAVASALERGARCGG
jgi:uncharacterized protein with von Willebrand factor type A (vWA) domain